MNIPLDDIEEKFLVTALKNGLSYWKKDQFEIIENNNSTIKARVYGTDEYLSELYFKNNSVIDVNCSCPNNRTLFCKHIAILYYEKFKDIFDLKKSKPKKTKSRQQKLSTAPKAISLEEKISTMPKKALEDLVRFGIKNDANFKSLVESKLKPKNQSEAEIFKFYTSEIKQLINSNKKQGYINYSASNKIGNHVIQYANKAEAFLEQQLPHQSFALCKAIIDCMLQALYYTDTSSGIFCQGLDIAIETAKAISEKNDLDDTLRTQMFSYFLKSFKKEGNHGFGYEEDLLDISIQLAVNNTDRKALEDTISKKDIDYYTLQIYAITKKFDGNEAAQQFIEKHKLLPEFRTILFNQFMDSEDYEGAKACMYEGIEANKEYSGIVLDWVKNLLEVANRTNDRDLKIRMSKTLFVNLGFSVYAENIEYYDVLKNELPEEEWEATLPELIEHIRDNETLKEIYYREGFLKSLYQSLTTKPNFYFGRNHLTFNPKYIEVLMLPYHDELQQFLQNRIEDFLGVYQGKNYYKEVCTTLITFKKAGMDINPIINYLKEAFNRRPSLQARLEEYFG